MAKINYWNIEQQIGSIIKTQVARATVLIEEEINWAEGDVVAIYLEEAQAPAELECGHSVTAIDHVQNLVLAFWLRQGQSPSHASPRQSGR